MFWENYTALCNQKEMSANAVAKILGVASGTVTSWKKGRVPHHGTLIEIADYFGVSVDYLLKGSEGAVDLDENTNARYDGEVMSNGTLKRLIQYLKSIGWSDSQIVALLDYITGK